jgi:hypothetical protein
MRLYLVIKDLKCAKRFEIFKWEFGKRKNTLIKIFFGILLKFSSKKSQLNSINHNWKRIDDFILNYHLSFCIEVFLALC